MAKARQIVKRRKAVSNIRKITRTMQLVATARFQQALQRATATKPYTRKIGEMVGHLSRAGAQVTDPLFDENPAAATDLLLVITSSRGLCGAYNANVLHRTLDHLKQTEAAGRRVELHCVGKKGIAYFKFLNRALAAAITNIDDRPRFEQVEPIAEAMMAAYRAGRFGRISVAYMRFISAGRQKAEVMQLLPIAALSEPSSGEAAAAGGTGAAGAGGAAMGAAAAGAAATDAGRQVQFDFSPEPSRLLAALLPQTIKVRLFQCFTDAAVSEQISRMVAMKSATDAAGDMIKDLSRRYNRARQSQITLELLDIVGGAEAIK